ncbi:MAG TPA: phosphatidate cytidylyltransferase [Gammaproteobacteria bacterium]|nr:phosphatidate cytidylyltransferase [Gammaproteobacteria bacterium]
MSELSQRVVSGLCLLLLLMGCYFYALIILPLAVFCLFQIQREARLMCGFKSSYLYSMLLLFSACLFGFIVLVFNLALWALFAGVLNVFVLYHLYRWPKVRVLEQTFLIWVGVFSPVFWLLYSQFDHVFLLHYMIAIAVVDTSAYFIGKQWGKHPICPMLSPKKSVEGWLGSIMVLYGYCWFMLYPQLSLISLGVVAFVFGSAVLVGDVFISSIKRQYQVKDTGSLIPGHGGVMDRLDGYVLVMPWFPVVYALLH